MTDSVRLSATLREDEDALHIDLSIDSERDGGIYFLAHPANLRGEPVQDRDAYVTYLDREETLLVSMIPPDPPGGVDYSHAVESLYRWLPPGGSYRASIDLDVPVIPWSPYPAPEGGPIGPDIGAEADLPDGIWASSIRLETGWFPASQLVNRQPGPVDGTYWCAGSGFRILRVTLEPARPVPVDLTGEANGD